MNMPSPRRRPMQAARAVLASALALALPLSAALAQTGPVPPDQFTLANGMTLIVQPDRRAPTAVQMLWVRVGSIDEVDGTSGVAHVLEHMLFKGTKDLKPGEFSRRVAALGGRENAFPIRAPKELLLLHRTPPSRDRDDPAPWNAPGLKLGSVEQETDDEAIEVHARADYWRVAGARRPPPWRDRRTSERRRATR